MKAVVVTAAVIVLAVAAYFGLVAAGILGSPATLTDEEITAGLESYAREINAEGGLQFDSFSRLSSATVVERQITIRGDALLDMAALGADYRDSREAQAINRLCRDETHRALLSSGAFYVFNWLSADGQVIGMVRMRDETCTAAGL